MSLDAENPHMQLHAIQDSDAVVMDTSHGFEIFAQSLTGFLLSPTLPHPDLTALMTLVHDSAKCALPTDIAGIDAAACLGDTKCMAAAAVAQVPMKKEDEEKEEHCPQHQHAHQRHHRRRNNKSTEQQLEEEEDESSRDIDNEGCPVGSVSIKTRAQCPLLYRIDTPNLVYTARITGDDLGETLRLLYALTGRSRSPAIFPLCMQEYARRRWRNPNASCSTVSDCPEEELRRTIQGTARCQVLLKAHCHDTQQQQQSGTSMDEADVEDGDGDSTTLVFTGGSDPTASRYIVYAFQQFVRSVQTLFKRCMQGYEHSTAQTTTAALYDTKEGLFFSTSQTPALLPPLVDDQKLPLPLLLQQTPSAAATTLGYSGYAHEFTVRSIRLHNVVLSMRTSLNTQNLTHLYESVDRKDTIQSLLAQDSGTMDLRLGWIEYSPEDFPAIITRWVVDDNGNALPLNTPTLEQKKRQQQQQPTRPPSSPPPPTASTSSCSSPARAMGHAMTLLLFRGGKAIVPGPRTNSQINAIVRATQRIVHTFELLVPRKPAEARPGVSATLASASLVGRKHARDS